MEFLLVDILLNPVGRLALILKYRDSEVRRKALKTDYDSSYSNAAKDILGTLFLMVFGLLLIAFLIIMLIISIF